MVKRTDTGIIPFHLLTSKCHIPFGVWMVLMVLFASCGREDTTYEAYYFPIKDLAEEQVYIYTPVTNLGFGKQIWLMGSHQSDTGWILQTRMFDETHTLLQEVMEQEVANGVLALSYLRHFTDSTGNVRTMPLEILRNNLFPYEVPDTTQGFTFKVRFPEPDNPDILTTRTRFRRFKGAERFTFEDKSLPAVVFSLSEKVEVEEEGVLTLTYSGEEIYAQGVGLVAWQQVPQPGDTLIYVLNKRMSRDAYELEFGKLE